MVDARPLLFVNALDDSTRKQEARIEEEDIAHRTVDLYLARQRSSTAKFYAVGLTISLSIFTVGIAWLSGLFG